MLPGPGTARPAACVDTYSAKKTLISSKASDINTETLYCAYRLRTNCEGIRTTWATISSSPEEALRYTENAH